MSLPKELGQLEVQEPVMFEMKFFNPVKIPFSAMIHYDMKTHKPYKLEFKKFLVDGFTPSACSHNVSSLHCYRYFLRRVPIQIKPFSLHLFCCPVCDAPVEYRFIVYDKPLNTYPKVKDKLKFFSKKTGKLKKGKKLPRAEQMDIQMMGVAENDSTK